MMSAYLLFSVSVLGAHFIYCGLRRKILRGEFLKDLIELVVKPRVVLAIPIGGAIPIVAVQESLVEFFF
jgi:hypothetical protein